MRQVTSLLLTLGGLLIGCSKWDVAPRNFYTSAVRGTLDAKPYQLYDLDQGMLLGSDKADFYWKAVDQRTFTLSPTNGATVVETSVPDPWNIPYLDLTKQAFKPVTITVGTYSNSIAYTTNEGRFGALRVSSYDFASNDLKLTWITYKR